MLACMYLVYPFLAGGWGAAVGALCMRRWALTGGLSAWARPWRSRCRADLIHSCLHSVMAVLPEPGGTASGAIEEVAPRWPCPGVGGPQQGLAASLLPVPVPGHHAGPQGLADEPPSAEHDTPGSAGHGGGVWRSVALCASWGWPVSQWAGLSGLGGMQTGAV